MARSGSRWTIVALLGLGIAVGVALTASPATSHVAGWTHNWNKHVRPKADNRYLPNANLPRGTTVRGAYVIRDIYAATGLSATSISFGHTLRSAPTPHFLPAGQSTAVCPGTPASPRAAAGHLCIYEAAFSNIGSYTVVNPATGLPDTATRWGVVLRVNSGGAGSFSTMGAWAVTAP
jgi:hypothetical protein